MARRIWATSGVATRNGDGKVAVVKLGGDAISRRRPRSTWRRGPMRWSITPDGKYAVVASLGDPKANGMLTVIDLSGDHAARSSAPPTSATRSLEGMMMSSDGKWIAGVAHAGSTRPKDAPQFKPNGMVVLYRLDGDKLTKVSEAPIGAWSQGASFSKDGKTLVVGNMIQKNMQVFKNDDGKLTDTGQTIPTSAAAPRRSAPRRIDEVRRNLILASLAAVAAGGAGAGRRAFPSQPVKVVVPFPPGGGTDALARAIQEPMQKALGQTVIIDNKGGAGGNLAHEYVAKQPPDGHTVLVSSNNQMLLSVPGRQARLRSGGLRADRLRRQAGIGVRRQRRCAVGRPGGDHRGGAQGAGRRAVRHGGRQHADAPVDRALRHPEQDQADARALSRHRPAGHRPSGRPHQARHVEPDQRAAAHPAAASSRPMAWRRPSARQSAPDIKTFKELGAGDVDGTIVYTLIAPPGTPAAAIAKLNEALNAGVSTPEMNEELRKRGFVAMGGTPQELATWTAVQARHLGPGAAGRGDQAGVVEPDPGPLMSYPPERAHPARS